MVCQAIYVYCSHAAIGRGGFAGDRTSLAHDDIFDRLTENYCIMFFGK